MVLSLKCHGVIFLFFTGKTPCEIHTVIFQNSTVTNVSLYHGEKQSDKWRDITVISPEFFKNFFPVNSLYFEKLGNLSSLFQRSKLPRTFLKETKTIIPFAWTFHVHFSKSIRNSFIFSRLSLFYWQNIFIIKHVKHISLKFSVWTQSDFVWFINSFTQVTAIRKAPFN